MKKEQITEVEFLNYIYKNAEMGLIGIQDIIVKVSSEKLANYLEKQSKEYKTICKDAVNILKKYGKQKEENGLMAKVGAKVMVEVDMLKENSDSNVAKLMIEGTNKGIIALVEKINAYNNSDEEIVGLASRFREILEDNVNELKKYL